MEITNDILLYIFLAPVGVLCTYLFARDVKVRFSVTLMMIFLLQIAESKVLLSFLAAAVFSGGFIHVLVKRKLLQRMSLANSPFFIPFSIFLMWSICIGFIGVCYGYIQFENWFRDILLWAPLLLLPIYYAEIIEKELHPEQFLSKCMFVWWIALLIVEVVNIKKSLTASLFLFQVGVTRYDAVNGAFMMFIFLSLAMIISDKRRLLLLGGFFLSVLSLLLSFARTAWVAVIPLLPIIMFLGNRNERRRGYKFISIIILCSTFFLIFGYFYINVIHTGLLFIGSKFLSVIHSKTDASLYGRFVEWRYLTQTILNSPLTGYGLGSKFETYNWFGGYIVKTGYSHSAYLSILFKSGIIGMILLFLSYIGYFIQGISYMNNPLLTIKERAYMRVGIVLMIFMTILGYTGNIFFQRELLLYIALYWCYCIQIEYKIKNTLLTITS